LHNADLKFLEVAIEAPTHLIIILSQLEVASSKGSTGGMPERELIASGGFRRV
jgi:hypothetical protein